jgi:hypothetical protein
MRRHAEALGRPQERIRRGLAVGIVAKGDNGLEPVRQIECRQVTLYGGMR